LIKDLTRPNGIAFSPDEKRLYVAVSDPASPKVWVYDVDAQGMPQNGRVFFDASKLTGPGLPDGMKVDLKGNVFTTAQGGVQILTPEGKHLGTINTGDKTANCAWGNDGSVLYMTVNHAICRVKTLTKGAIPGK
jgi:gluconolactonase